MTEWIVGLIGPGGAAAILAACVAWAAKPFLEGRVRGWLERRELRRYGYGRRTRR